MNSNSQKSPLKKKNDKRKSSLSEIENAIDSYLLEMYPSNQIKHKKVKITIEDDEESAQKMLLL